jgi:hypothetical protein
MLLLATDLHVTHTNDRYLSHLIICWEIELFKVVKTGWPKCAMGFIVGAKNSV